MVEGAPQWNANLYGFLVVLVSLLYILSHGHRPLWIIGSALIMGLATYLPTNVVAIYGWTPLLYSIPKPSGTLHD